MRSHKGEANLQQGAAGPSCNVHRTAGLQEFRELVPLHNKPVQKLGLLLQLLEPVFLNRRNSHIAKARLSESAGWGRKNWRKKCGKSQIARRARLEGTGRRPGLEARELHQA